MSPLCVLLENIVICLGHSQGFPSNVRIRAHPVIHRNTARCNPLGDSVHHYLWKPSGDDDEALQECRWLGRTTDRVFRLYVGRLLLGGSPGYRHVRETSCGCIWAKFASTIWGPFVTACIIAGCARLRNCLVYRML